MATQVEGSFRGLVLILTLLGSLLLASMIVIVPGSLMPFAKGAAGIGVLCLLTELIIDIRGLSNHNQTKYEQAGDARRREPSASQLIGRPPEKETEVPYDPLDPSGSVEQQATGARCPGRPRAAGHGAASVGA